jgi:hypothetical protein
VQRIIIFLQTASENKTLFSHCGFVSDSTTR